MRTHWFAVLFALAALAVASPAGAAEEAEDEAAEGAAEADGLGEGWLASEEEEEGPVFERLPVEYAVAYVNGEPVAQSDILAASKEYGELLGRRAKGAAAGTWTAADEVLFEDSRFRALGQVVARRLVLQEARRGVLVHLGRRFGQKAMHEIFGDLVDENVSPYALARMRITLGMYRLYDRNFDRRFEERLRRLGGPAGLWKKHTLTPEQYRRRFFEQSIVEEYYRMVLLLDASPAPCEIRAYYEKHRSRFSRGEAVEARLLTIRWNVRDRSTGRMRDRVAARELAGRLRAEAAADPARFPALVRARSDDALTREAGGRMGPDGAPSFTRGTYPRAIEDAAFATPPGRVSRVIETNDGFHVIRVEAHRPAGVRPLAEIEREVRSEVAKEKHERQVGRIVERLYGRAAVVDAEGRRIRYEALFGPRPAEPAGAPRP